MAIMSATMPSLIALSGRALCRSTAVVTMKSVTVAADIALGTGSPIRSAMP